MCREGNFIVADVKVYCMNTNMVLHVKFNFVSFKPMSNRMQ